MKIWSLLPSATEIVCALGAGDELTGITHECDYPPEVTGKPRVTVSYIDSAQPSRAIDDQVTSHFQTGRQLYGIDEERLALDPPDLIITQDLCPVCAVSPSDFQSHMQATSCRAQTICLNPNFLEDMLDGVMEIGEAIGRAVQAVEFVDSLQDRIAVLRSAVDGSPRPRTLCLEWLDPPMPGGHWVPQMVAHAGGESQPIAPGEPSRKVPWTELRGFRPEVIVLMPCGFGMERAARESEVLRTLHGWDDTPAVRSGEVYAVDGNAHFSRPGPRLVDGIEVLAHILHPDRVAAPPAGSMLQLPREP